MRNLLNSDRGLVFRITHIANIAWIAKHGLHCASSNILDPNFVPIGNAELIGKRRHRAVPQPYGGYLSDYVPFYFTPHSVMLMNIETGWGGVRRVPSDEIVFIVSSIKRLGENGRTVIFTDRHAYLETANWFHEAGELTNLDWSILQSKDFKTDPNYPEKKERYQAEALALRCAPVESLLGLACRSTVARQSVEHELNRVGSSLRVEVRSDWYFK